MKISVSSLGDSATAPIFVMREARSWQNQRGWQAPRSRGHFMCHGLQLTAQRDASHVEAVFIHLCHRLCFRCQQLNDLCCRDERAEVALTISRTWSPRRGTSPPLERTSGLPSKAAIYGLALPRHHRTRHPYCAGRARQLMFRREVCCSCRPPLCGGRSAPPRGEGHTISVCARARRSGGVARFS